MAELLTIFPPVLALVVAVWTRNVFLALGLAVWASETLLARFNPFLGLLGTVDRAVEVFASAGNTRILLFCLLIGALIAFMRQSGGIAALVESLQRRGVASTPRRAGGVVFVSGILLFIETNVSLLSTGVLGRPLFDRLNLSRARLAYIIDSTCAPVCVLVLLNGWGAYLLSLMAANGVENAFPVLLQTVLFNAYAWLTIGLVLVTILTNRTFGPLARRDRQGAPAAPVAAAVVGEDQNTALSEGRAIYMAVPMVILVGGSIGFMAWTGGGNITAGSGAQSILWALVIATLAAGIFFALARRGTTREGPSTDAASQRGRDGAVEIGFQGMGDMLPAVAVILLALVLGASLRALGTGEFIAGLASVLPFPQLFPAMLFLAAGLVSFSTGTSWGTFGLLVPIAIPLAVSGDIPLALMMAAVIGGGVFGDHCSPISDTTIIASLAAECDHVEHVETQLPYALAAGGATLLLYGVMGYLA
ncbi:MAG: Na+/H+ antiporter NhaC family protein [Pseudomonadota bacterium]